MSASPQPPLLEQPHRNHGLFSDHYLNETLPGRSDWQELLGDAGLVMEQVKALFEGYNPAPNEKEAQTEEDCVRPVLKILGHADFAVQPSLKVPGSPQAPDYVFYNDQAAKDANATHKLLDDELLESKAYAVGDAKRWERPLDVPLKEGADPFDNKNPSYQIAFYVQHSGMEWGILTNGRLWRLYHRGTAHKLDLYYEVDLPELLATGDVEAFLYFYTFFHRSAFEEHPLGVGAILRASADYARGVGDTLKVQVYEALRHVAQGFLDYPANGLTTDPATLKEIYDNSLIVLYRLLFVLYAESRDLLPVGESEMYRDTYSLHAIKHDVSQGRSLLPTSATLWPRLRELFGIINDGSPPLKVATFNGGLFDPARHPFIERHGVGDGHLQQAIDNLARVDGQFVDYRDLAERHLGTIYEGLLEFHLEALPEPEEGWTVALLNDKGERKATGSYYTPDYVVKYIVEETVGPVLREAVEGAESDEEKVGAVLGLNVLDPSMGSGHFLVEATEHIARFLVGLDVSPEETDGEAELAYWKRRVAQSCVYGVDLNPLAVDLAKLSLWLATVAKDRPLSFLDHHLRTGNSLLGARIFDLRPSIRKKGKKADYDDTGQLSMVGDPAFQSSMSTAVGNMWLIEESPAETVADVKEQERLYERLRETLTEKHGRLADLATATYFGIEIDASLWSSLAQYAAEGGEEDAVRRKYKEWLDDAAAVAEERRFFHWELEFPEVFFDRHGRPLGDEAGFDAVVGNPPYVQSKHFPELKPYLQAAYPETYKGRADLYVYFFHLGLSKSKNEERIGYISSGLFSKLDYGAPLRQHLTSRSTLLEIVEFSEEQVFEGAQTYPVILSLKNEPPKKNATLGLRSAANLTDGTPPEQNPLPKADDVWAFAIESLQHVIRGWAKSTPLDEYIDGSMHRGITTGLNEAFVLDQATRDELVREDPSSEALTKPFVRGEGLRPWYQNEKLWLILLPCGWTRATFGSGAEEEEAWAFLKARYPSVAKHLAPFAETARKRTDKGEYWWELRPCQYYSAFEHPRIHSTKVSLFPTFSFSEEVNYALNTSYVLPLEDRIMGNYLLGILNSRVCEFYCRKVFAPKANGYFEIQPRELSRMPVPDASDTERGKVGRLAEAITAEARARYTLHESTRWRILSDLVPSDSGKKLNQKLTAWWNLDFPAFRAEVKKVFKKDIPLGERDEWEDWLSGRRAEHERRTAEIVRLETELNARVYELFDLTPDEIQIIEASTKYRYGEV